MPLRLINDNGVLRTPDDVCLFSEIENDLPDTSDEVDAHIVEWPQSGPNFRLRLAQALRDAKQLGDISHGVSEVMLPDGSVFEC